uniref:phospholipase D1-like isoform X1 n=1 Tax=Myxine glutinosa TaxID=7769 RepID=UPI00358E9524
MDLEKGEVDSHVQGSVSTQQLIHMDSQEALEEEEVCEEGNQGAAGGGKIPFSRIYNLQGSTPFLANTEVHVRVTENVRVGKQKQGGISPYKVEFTHGEFVWNIRCSYKQVQALHNTLRQYRALLHLPLLARNFQDRIPKSASGNRRIPELPSELNACESEDLDLEAGPMSSRKRQIENYLSSILKIPIYRNHHATLEVLEVSPLSFVHDLGPKGIECKIQKRSGGYRLMCMNCCNDICTHWSQRWLVVKDSFLLYLQSKDQKICGVLLFDKEFSISSGKGITNVKNGVVITNLSRTLTIRCPSYQQCLWLSHEVNELVQKQCTSYTMENRFGSYAPRRENSLTRWFVNGERYFSEVADAMEKAKEEIFITDWWLSPEIFLKRPVVEGNYWRLDVMLKRKAEAGVKIFVLLYKEVEMALGINSYYSKHCLMSLHPNIKVLRHPDHLTSAVLLWAHHEKIVVIDQSVAFLGGIDLAYGRCDNADHRLTDIGSVQKNVHHEEPMNQHQKNGEGVAGQKTSLDAPDPCASTETIVPDITSLDSGVKVARPGRDRWQKALKKMPQHTSETFTESDGGVQIEERHKTISGILQKWRPGRGRSPRRNKRGVRTKMELSADSCVSVEVFGQARYWHGKDYCNFILKDFEQLDKPFDDFIDRFRTPRMPWHDIGVAVHGASARDVARHFIQRWNFTKRVKQKQSIASFPELVPKSFITADNLPFTVRGAISANVQVLRSVGEWSAGFRGHEKSILEAYLWAIKESQHYVYIENQFFISCSDDKTIYNSIGDVLVEKILEAHSANRRYRVYILLPLLPGFQGDIKTGGGNAIQTIMHFNYRTMCRGKYSIVERVKAAVGREWMNYISFCSLRTHDSLNGKPVTELIYIHSKLLIADDRTVIIGSANINDRSLLGRRDSEMAIVLEDSHLVDSVMDGMPYRAGRFALGLRMYCFRLVLGKLKQAFDLYDPVCEGFYKGVWMTVAGRNTTIFEKVFKCLPSDHVLNFGQLKNWSNGALVNEDPARAQRQLAKIQGYLVCFPLFFLKEEHLQPALNTKEGIVPSELWT